MPNRYSNKKYFKFLGQFNIASLVLFLAGVLGFIISISVNHLYSLGMNTNNIILIFSITLILIVAITIYNNYFLNHIIIEKIDEITSSFTSEKAKNESWFVSHFSLGIKEEKMKKENIDEIWVVSRELNYEKPESLFREAIIDNLNEGILYHYLIPDDSRYKRIAEKIKKQLGKENKDKIKIHPIPLAEFNYLSDIVIYDPMDKCDTQGFMELIIHDKIENRGWIKIQEEQLQTIIDRIKKHISEW